MFRSVIEYGCQIFGLEGNRTTFNIINRMQYQAFRVAYGYRGSTLINILHCEACEPPLRARMAIVSRRYIFRCLSNPRGPALNYLLSCKWAMLASSQSTREKTLKKFQLLSYFVSLEYLSKDIYQSDIPPTLDQDYNLITFRPAIDISMVAFKEEEKREQLQPQLLHLLCSEYPDYLQIFTDGSVSQDGEAVGSGVYIPFTCSKLGYKLPEGISIFSAEILAMLIAVQQTLDRNWTKTVILTDSLSALQALHNSTNHKNNYLLA